MSSNDGTILNNRYKLLERAGTGGMASVYKAQDLMLGRLIAVKVLHESLTGNADFLRRFQQEAYSAANLSHPNIVTVHDIGQDGHYYYIVMELIEGQTLKELIRKQVSATNQPLNINRALDLAIQICAGVGYAHRAGLVHCDVKSQNVLVTRDNRVKVADFGIARAMSQTNAGNDSMVWGTPQYFAPEQAAGENATPASDVYSIGVILFEMLTGRLPFEAENHAAYAVKHMNETPPPVTRFNPAVPLQIERVIAKVLSKEPAGRYRTADQFGRILITYRENSLEDTGPLREEEPARPAVSDTPSETPIAARQTEFYQPSQSQPVGTGPIAERRTEYYNPDDQPTAERQTHYYQPDDTLGRPRDLLYNQPPQQEGADRTTFILSILAIIALLGLIPLWLIVYLQYAQ